MLVYLLYRYEYDTAFLVDIYRTGGDAMNAAQGREAWDGEFIWYLVTEFGRTKWITAPEYPAYEVHKWEVK